MKWCYKPCKLKRADGSEYWVIKEYYEIDDKTGCTEGSAYPAGDTREELQEDLWAMMKASLIGEVDHE